MFDRFNKIVPLLVLTSGLVAWTTGSASPHAAATAAPPAQTVIVTVNGQALTAAQVNAYVRLRTHHSHRHVTPQQKRTITEELVQITLATQAAKKAGLENTPTVRAELQLQDSLYLANESVRRYVNAHKPSEKVLHQKYKKMVKARSGKQYKVRNILVKTKAEAQRIIGRLDHGADFAALAKKYSLDKLSSGQGGELGWLRAHQKRIPEFASVVAELKPGQYTKTPIQTQKGWEIILMEQARTPPPPKYSAVKPVLVQQAERDTTQHYLDQLKSQAHIVWNTPSAAPAAQTATNGSHTP